MRRALVLLALGACSGDDAPPFIDELACDHFENGPFQTLVLGDARDSSAPEVEIGTVYRVGEGSAGGFGAFGATGARYGVFMTSDVTIELTDPSGAVVVPDEDDPSSSACTAVAHRLVVSTELGVYYVELSAGAANLYLVPEPSTPD